MRRGGTATSGPGRIFSLVAVVPISRSGRDRTFSSGRPRADHRGDPGWSPHQLVPVKQSLRLDYDRLADSIRDKQLIDSEVLKQVLDQARASGSLFPELLVNEGLLSDWEVSRVAAEVFNLAFLPVEYYEPDLELLEKFDSTFLRQNILVPLDRFGDVLTVAMPGMVPSEVLTEIEENQGVTVLPVVGSVRSNANWLETNLPEAKVLKAIVDEVESDDSWGALFDVGDEAVRTGLDVEAVTFDPEREDEPIDLADEDEPTRAAVAPKRMPEPAESGDEAETLELDLDLDLDLGSAR